MKINFLWIVLYIAMVVLLPFTMMDPEETLMPYWAMAVVTMLLYALFMLAWIRLMKRTLTRYTVHKWLYAVITWWTLLTIGDLLMFQEMKNLQVIIGMLIIVVIGLMVNRRNSNIVDGLMAGVIFLVLYGAMQFEHVTLPAGIIGGLVITLLFMIISALRDWPVTLGLARGAFFFTVTVVFIFVSPWPIFSDDGYLLYILLTLFIVAYFVGRKKPILLPQSWMPWLIGLSVFIVGLKFL